MTYDELMPEEPGDEQREISPGFNDRLMQRIENYQRRQRRQRTAAVVLTMACLVSGGYVLTTRQAVDVQKPAMVRMQATPAAAPAVKAAQVQQAASPRDAVKPRTPAPQLASHARSEAPVNEAGIQPGDLRITIDGKELHGAALEAAKIQMGLTKCTPTKIELVRDGKPVKYSVPASQAGNGRCQ